MDRPNQEVEIFRGELTLTNRDTGVATKLKGRVWFGWFPGKCVVFEGRCWADGHRFDPDMAFGDPSKQDLAFDGLRNTPTQITRFLTTGSHEVQVEGILLEPVVTGDPAHLAQSFEFSIPNLLPQVGRIRFRHPGMIQYSELTLFGNEDVHVLFDDQYSDRSDLLVKQGGYLITAAVTVKTDQPLTLKKARQLTDKICAFLSFISGAQIGGFFLKGNWDGTIVWTDYQVNAADIFRHVIAWPNQTQSDFQGLWTVFCQKWEIEIEQTFLKRGLKWYNLANQFSHEPDNAIIIAQTALELVFNRFTELDWIVLPSKDAAKTAAEKIRQILLKIKVEPWLPRPMDHLVKFLKVESDDAPKVIVNIRNSLVHSRHDAASQLVEYSVMEKWQAANLFLWYLELALLYYLDHQGEYNCRVLPFAAVKIYGVPVPWAKQGAAAD